MDYQKIIDYYFPEETNGELRNILLTHSKCVAAMAMEICLKHPELNTDCAFVYDAAMLHDIGIVRCNAEGIHCFGQEPYIRHGMMGAKMLEEYASKFLPCTDIAPYARVCARHTGTGLTAKTIKAQGLPLPEQDFTPETTEEQIICYADKFFSKTKLDKRKTLGEAEKSLMKFGKDGVEVFRKWHETFG